MEFINSDGKVDFDKIPEDIEIYFNYFNEYSETKKISSIRFNYQELLYSIGLIHNNDYIDLNVNKIDAAIQNGIFAKQAFIKKK